MRTLLLGLLLIMTLPTSSLAETLFVADNLRVGVRAEPFNKSPSIAIINTGTPIDILETKGNYVKVRTPSGAEGWVKSAYLSPEKPALLHLKEATEKLQQLEQELASFNSKIPENRAAIQDLKQQIAKLEAEKSGLADKLNNSSPLLTSPTLNNLVNNPVVQVLPIASNPVLFMLILLGVILVLGFLVGVSWHRHQVTKRLGGLTL